MARPVSDEELQLKQRARRRLIGAVVLVTIAAVILPMVLDSEPKPLTQSIDIHIPSPDSGEFKPKAGPPAAGTAATGSQQQAKSAPPSALPAAPPVPIAGLPEAPRATQTTERTPSTDLVATPPAADGAREGIRSTAKESTRDKEPPATGREKGRDKEPATMAKEMAREKEAPAPVKEKGREKEAPALAKESTPPATAMGAYAVQVAALSDARRVKELEKQMAGAGLRTYTEVVNTQAGEITRVRAGPYASREAAEKARVQLRKVGLDGKVVQK